MALEFSPEVRQTAAVFTEYRNSIDIYTEDCVKDKPFYVKLMNRLLADTGIIINDIHPLGCRREVIEFCQNDTDDRRKRIYIVDGDIYLQFKEKENIEHLYVLDAYCIENYVICEDAICNVACFLYGQASLEVIKNTLNISQALNEIEKPLIDLFFYYSIQMECTNQFRLLSIEAYMDNTNRIDSAKIIAKISEIRNGLIHYGITEDKIDELLNKRRLHFPYNEQTLLRIVSGKDFIIPYFRHHINRSLNCKISLPKEAWKYNFVDKCDILKLEPLKQAILSA
ncbi:MAG: DUF4435 domain-containing protein [Prevotella sp.]|nr:DUF4435 domain-containing protein [Prevotella sp.]